MTFYQILQFLMNGFSAVYSWFQSILDSIPGSFATWGSLFVVAGIVRLILIPALGNRLHSGSDKVVSSLSRDNSDKMHIQKSERVFGR